MAGADLPAGAASVGPCAACVAGWPALAPSPAGEGVAAVVDEAEAAWAARSCSICCILSIDDLSARGKTGSTLPSFPPHGSWPHFRSVRLNLLISPSPNWFQILAVDSGSTGCASAVTMRRASAAVYKMVARRALFSSPSFSATIHGSSSTRYLLTAPISDHAFSSALEN